MRRVRQRGGWAILGAVGVLLAGCGSSSGAGGSSATADSATGGASATGAAAGVASSAATGAPAGTAAQDGLLASAKAVASAITSANAAGGGTGAKACAAFSPAEVAAFVGADLAGPEVNGPLGTQCQWIAADPADQDSTATVQVVGADYWERHSTDPVPGVSGESFVGPALGGWEAGAQDGPTQVVYVSVTGPKASKETVSAFLKLAMDRL